MKANVEVICYKSKPLKDGSFPLMLRITKDRKRKYISLGISLFEQFWDFEKNKPKRNCPNKENITNLISAKLSEYNTLIIELTAEQREYTPETLVNSLESKVTVKTVKELYMHLIDKLKRDGRLGNAEVYKYSHESLKAFTSNRLNIQFRDIDTAFLKRYEDWLRKRGCKETSISQLFRTLRSVYNKAIEQNIVKRDYYPFHSYKVSKFDISTNKRAITKEDVKKIMELDLSDKGLYMRLAQEMFVFSYFGAGINFSDIALLRFNSVKDGRVYYIRKKTGKPINFALSEPTEQIISRYANEPHAEDDYIFPILNSRFHKTEQQKHDRLHKSLRKVNRELRKIGEMIGVTDLTTYVARHRVLPLWLKTSLLQRCFT